MKKEVYMWRHILLLAVVLIIGISSANANLFLTIDGENPTGIPLMLSGTGPYTIVLDGNTPIESNDIRFEVITGVLTAIPDTNNQYTFQYEGEATTALIRLIANTDMTIDGYLAPAGMTIYELFVFCNPEFEFTGACGSDVAVFIPPPEEEGGEGDSIIEGQESSTMSDEGGGESLLDSVIEISSDITTNQIWTDNNIYHIAEDINVTALLVIEPGTVVKFASNKSLSINNGGTLISSGTPDNLIKYTSDSATPDYGDYFCPIYIEETASSSTKITYSYIEYATVGIYSFNKRLDHAIENNYLYKNGWGIYEYGTDLTDIINNLIYGTYNYGIGIDMASYEGQASLTLPPKTVPLVIRVPAC